MMEPLGYGRAVLLYAEVCFMPETWVAPVRAVRAQKILASTPRYARSDVFAQVPEQEVARMPVGFGDRWR